MADESPLNEVRRQNQMEGLNHIEWLHNPARMTMWAIDNAPLDWWESNIPRYNGMCVLRYIDGMYTVTFKDHQTLRTSKEGDYKRALFIALEMIRDRMKELFVSTKIEDYDVLFPKLAKYWSDMVLVPENRIKETEKNRI